MNVGAEIVDAMMPFVGCSRAEVVRAAHRGRIVRCGRWSWDDRVGRDGEHGAVVNHDLVGAAAIMNVMDDALRGMW